MTDEPAPTLTYGLRELVWGIESEVAVISNLSRRVDDHVRALNQARKELAERLTQLDDLVDAAEDAHLRQFLVGQVSCPLPTEAEHFPERMYGG